MSGKSRKLKPVGGFRRPSTEDELSQQLRQHLIISRLATHVPSSCGQHGYVFRVAAGVTSSVEYGGQKIEGLLGLVQRFADVAMKVATTFEEDTPAGTRARKLLAEIISYTSTPPEEAPNVDETPEAAAEATSDQPDPRGADPNPTDAGA